MRTDTFWLKGAFLGLFCLNLARAEEVSWTPPQTYTKQLAGLLTPRSEILQASKVAATDDRAAGRALVDERIHYLNADGGRFIVRQVAYQTLSNAGVESNSIDIFSFRKKDEKFYVLMAETIQPDGTAQIVKPDAVIVQSPQRNAQYSEYDDLSEVRIVYPSVKPGAITHSIIAIEESRPQISGEYTYVLTRGSAWATTKQRFVLNLPDELRKRLKIDPTGPYAPALVEAKLADGRSSLTWTKLNLPAQTGEVYPAPDDQSGSAIHLTTLSGWEDVDKWFRGLLQGRDQVNAAMKAKVDEWTAKAAGQDDIVRLLLAKAANDVRYTGMEFGDADYQPHDCNEVWGNQYGDCKDKANLLATWLRYKGIPAKLVLLNADHAGLIDLHSPDMKAFNHMIVAIPDKHGYLFCDPTITYAKPGMLGPNDADRDVMVLASPGKVEWVRTPAQVAGSVAYHFELKQNPAGDLSGWLTFTSSGYYASSETETFQKMTADQARDHMEDLVQDFYKGARVMDIARPSSAPDSDDYVVKAYFLVPGNSTISSDRQPLLYPNANSVLPELGSSSKRDTSYFSNRDKISVSLDLTLPDGLAPGDLPKPYQITLPSGVMQGQWLSTATTCHFELSLVQTQSLIQPDKFVDYYNAIQSLSAWLAQPVLLNKGPVIASTPAADTNTIDFPMMPSGDGQINLVDEKYPITGSHSLRRAALEKTLAYFPQDKLTAFRAKMRLAIVDWNEDKNKEALDQVNTLLATYKSDVDLNSLSWAEDTQAMILQDLGRNDEALAIFTQLANDTSLSEERRSDCALSAARVLQKKSAADAIAMLETALPLKTGEAEDIYSLLGRLMLQENRGDALRQHFQQLLQADASNGQKVLLAVVTNSASWTQPSDLPTRPALLKLVSELVPQPGPDLQKALEANKDSLALGEACQKIQADLKAALATKPLSDWYRPVSDASLKKIEDFDAAFQKANSDNNADLCTQITVQILVAFPPAADFPDRLWKATAEAELKEKQETPPNEPVLAELLNLCAQLPETCDDYFEGKFILGRHLARIGDSAGERNLYLAMIKDPQITDTFLPYTLKHLGANYENAPDYAKALETYKGVERLAGKYNSVGDTLLRAIFINLQQDDPKEALRIIQLLSGVDEAMLKKCQDYNQIQELIALYRSGKAEAFWTQSAIWWPQWQSLAQSLGVSGPDQTVMVPDIADLTEFGEGLGTAVRGNDPNAYFKGYARLVSAARWLPGMAFELASLAESSGQMAPAKVSDLRLLFIAQLEAAEVAGEARDARQRHLMLAANYLDAGQPDKALAVITSFFAQPNPDDAVNWAMHRVWGLVALALQKDYDAPIKALEADLQKTGVSKRLSGAGVLSDLYLAEGKSADAQALLKRELDDPKNKADAAGYNDLTERSRKLVGGSTFSKQVETWLKTNKPGWYDFAEPVDLHDSRLANLDEILKSAHPPFNEVEMTKLELLVAQADSQPMEVRQNAFNNAVGNLLGMTSTQPEARQIIRSIVVGNLFDDDVRSYWLWLGLFDAVAHRQKDDYAQWSADALTARFNPTQKEFLPLGKEFLEIDPTSAPALTAFAKRLVQSPVDAIRIELLRQVSGLLLRLGDVQDCQALADGIPSWTISPNGSAKESLQLDWARQIDHLRGGGSVGDDMAKVVLDHYPHLPSLQPAEYSTFRNLDPLPVLGKEVTLQECLYLIKTAQYDRSTFSLWTNFVRSLPDNPESIQLGSELIDVALKQAANDQQRSDAVNFAVDSIDTDNPKKWEALQQSLSPYLQPAQPLTFSAIQTAQVRINLRTGKRIDLASAFSGIHQPEMELEEVYVQLQQALAQQDRDTLTRLINNMDSNQLLLPGFLRFTLPALDMLQMKTEAGLARQAAEKELYHALVISWATHNPGEVRLALRLALVLDRPDALPQAWVQEMGEKVTDPLVRLNVALADAKLHKDWANVFKTSDQITQSYPTFYDFYWDKGMSLYQLGRKEDAVGPLVTFATYCKDQIEYPQAVALLKTMGKASF